MQIDLTGSPYSLTPAANDELVRAVEKIERRVQLLRNSTDPKEAKLTKETLEDYYGRKRWEQVAESNALEGNTLSAGETKLAIFKGITITGHDPAHVRDARALYAALQQVAEWAKDREKATDLAEVRELHKLILGGEGEQRGAGEFRKEAVRISGAAHVPPQTGDQVEQQMRYWEQWSQKNLNAPAVVRAAVLHAWLAHIHPFLDGNGRTARAIGNLQLIRAGYPPLLIKKKSRDRYLDALSLSDEGGNLGEFFQLIIDKANDALTGLVQSAKENQGYDEHAKAIEALQEKRLRIWNTSVKLLFEIVYVRLSEQIKNHGKINLKEYEPLDLEDYLEVCQGNNISKSYQALLEAKIHGANAFTKLAWVGSRSPQLHQFLDRVGGPSLFWSKKNPDSDGYHRWLPDDTPPAYEEMTIKVGQGDEWYVRDGSELKAINTTALADKITEALYQQLTEQ